MNVLDGCVMHGAQGRPRGLARTGYTEYRTEYIQYRQGWEFALWFFVRIARFLRATEQKSDLLFEKSELLFSLFL